MSALFAVAAEVLSLAWIELAAFAGASACYALFRDGLLSVGVAHELENMQAAKIPGRTSAVAAAVNSVLGSFKRQGRASGGGWAADFAVVASTRHHAEVFEDAARLLGALRPEQAAVDGMQVHGFVGSVVTQLRHFDASCVKTRERALGVVELACAQKALLPAGAEDDMREALGVSAEQASAAYPGGRPRPPCSRPASKGPSPPLGRDASRALALSALGVLSGHHQGLGAEAALQKVADLGDGNRE